VRILLERSDINPGATDEDNRMPLSWAASRRVSWPEAKEAYERAVWIMLGRNEVNPDTADKSGRTPLSWAAEGGCEEMARMLLEWTDVNPGRPDESGRTPLSWVAKNGHEKIVGMLLQRNKACSGAADGNGQKSYLCVAGNDSGRVAQGQAVSYDLLSISGRAGELPGPFATNPSPLLEPPPKKIRRF